jgi:hypothetical protein
MATRSALLNMTTGQMNYVHNDGYPGGERGRMSILELGYNDPDSVKALFQRCFNTDISVLGPTIETSVFYDQRGESGRQWTNLKTDIENAIKSLEYSDCEYLYTWNGTKWNWIDLYQPNTNTVFPE